MKTMRQLMIALLLMISLEGFGASPTITGFSPASGPVGTVVTITGTNLSSETGFTIGGVSAIVVSNTATKIVGLVMPGAATGAISVTTSGGTASGTLYPTSQMGPKLVGSGSVSGWGVGGIDSAFQGWSVAISGDGNTAMVGGPADSLNVGAAWVYIRYNNGTWVQQGHKLVGTGEVGWGSRQGSAVALSGDGNTAVIGGLDDDNGTGAVWIFTRSNSIWTQQGSKLVASGSNGTSLQGCSVAISADGNTVLVGGYGNGGAWVYTRSGTTWTQQGGKLLGTGAVNPGFGIYQGWSVALSADGNTAMVGSPYDNNNMGAAWVFTRSGTTWTQQGSKLVGTGSVGTYVLQGWSVALSADGNTALLGGIDDNSAGAVWVFTRSGTTWAQQGAKLAAGTGEALGSSVSLSADGNTAVIGAYYDNGGVGALWNFTRSGTTWTEQGSRLIGSGAAGNAREGGAISLSADGNTVITGGLSDSGGVGAAWIFTDSIFALAGPDQIICKNTTVTMAGHGNGAWTLGSGPPPAYTNITTPSSNTTTVTGFSVAGIYKFAWTGTGFSDTMTVTVDSICGSGGSAGPDQVICRNIPFPDTFTVAMAATGSGGTWTALSSNPQFTTIQNPTSPTTGISALPYGWSSGVYRFVWTVGGVPDTMSVTIDSFAVIFNVSVLPTVSSVCTGGRDTFSVIANTSGNPPVTSWSAVPLSFQWYENDTAVGTNSYKYSSSTLDPGDSIWVVVTIPNNFCLNGHIGTDTLPASFVVNNCGCNITDSISYALNNFNGEATFTAHSTGTAHPAYAWSIVPANGTFFHSGNTAEFHNFPGGHSYTVICDIQDSVTGCTNSDTFFMPCNAHVDSISYVNVGGDNYIFTAQTASTSPILVWSDISLNNSYQHMDTVIGYDTVRLMLPPGANSIAVIDQGCDIQDSIVVIAPQLYSAGPDQTLCLRQLAFSSDTVTMAATGTGTWYTLPGNTQSNTVIQSPSSPTTIIYANPWLAGVYGFVWTTTGGSDTMYVTMDSVDLVLGISVSQPTVCSGSRDSFTATLVSNGINSMSYLWYVNSTLAGSGQTYVDPSVNSGDNIQVVVTSLLGCVDYHLGADTIPVSFTVTNCASVDTVWPGDADNNKLVDNRDLLTIGLGYDSTGPVRVVTGNLWQADLATDWAHDFTIYLPAVNFVHADCDGNGVINADDTTAMALNWGDTHAKTNNLPGPWRSGISGMTIQLSQDTIYNNDTLITNIFLGDSATPVNGIYGLAFTFNYDPLVVDSNYSMFNFISSQLWSSTNSINFNRNLSTGQVKAAITGIDHMPRSGYGQIATFRCIITTDNINGKNYSYYNNLNYISDITAIDQFGNHIPLNAGIDSNKVGFFLNGIRDISRATKVNVYPNPAADQVRITSTSAMTDIRIIDIIGNEILTISADNKQSATLDISHLAAGVYTVHVSSQTGVGTAKLIISR